MGKILRKFKWILSLLIPLFIVTNTANAESHSVWMDSTFTTFKIETNPYFLQEHYNGLNSVETGYALDFTYIFNGLNPESKVCVYHMNGDSLTSIRVGDSVLFYMPDEDVYLSIKNPMYEITYDSNYIDYFEGYNNPMSAEAGTLVNIVFKEGIIPGGTQLLYGNSWFLKNITVKDSIASFVMPFANVNLTAATMTGISIIDNIQCEGGTLRHPETGNAGETFYFNACPDNGYYISNINTSDCEDFRKVDDTTYSFVMLPNLPAVINVCFEELPTYHSITLDSTFAKYNITVNPYWLRNSKGLDSILVGEQLDFMYMFRGLNYESTVSVREKNGGLIYKHMMGDSVDFFMPDSNIVLSVENPVYEITYDSAYINHFNGFSYPISAEAGTTVKILYEGDIIARVSRETWNGSWTTMDETTIGWERSNTWSVTFTMPFTNVLVGSAQTKDLPIYKQINCGEGQINCPQEVGNARDTIWFTVHPDAGYTIQSVNVTGGRQFHAWDDTTYMFEMVEDKSATIYACFEPISVYHSIIVDSSCAKMMDEYAVLFFIGSAHAYNIREHSTIEDVPSGTRVTLAGFGNPNSELKKWVKVTTQSGQDVKVNTCSYCDSVWFFMPTELVYIAMEKPTYHSITVDSTFTKYNVTVNPYWLNKNKGLDSIPVGERVDFMYVFNGLVYESVVSVREKNGGLIYKHMMGDSVDFFMPDSDIVLTVQNPTYEIRYDSTYINHFNGFSYPISAEAGTTVKILYEGGIIANVSREIWNGRWSKVGETSTGSEGNNIWSVTFTMPFANVLVGAAQTKDLPINKQINCGEGQINCPKMVGNARDTIWFSVHPAAGYTVRSVNVTGGRQFQAWDDTTYMFEMVEDESAWIYACFEPIPVYHSITLDSTFAKHNITCDSYWLQDSKGLDSILVGEQLYFMSMFAGLDYESTVSIREKNGGLIYEQKMSDNVNFFMPDSDIVLSVKNPVYEIIYDSTYIDYFNDFSYPISAEAGTTVEIMFEKGFRPKVMRKNWVGNWTMQISSTFVNDSVISFVMPYELVKVTASQTTNLAINLNGFRGGIVRCPSSGNAGDTIVFSVVPDPGYILNRVSVSGASYYQIDDTLYAFVMEPDNDVWVYPYFKCVVKNSIIIDESFSKNVKGKIQLYTEESESYEIGKVSKIDSVTGDTHIYMELWGDVDVDKVMLRTASGKEVEVWGRQWDSASFRMPVEKLYISYIEAAIKLNIDTIVSCGKGRIRCQQTAYADDTVWFNVYPAVGYHVESVNATNCRLYKTDDTTYVVLTDDKDVQITACFAIDMICGCTDPVALNYDSMATVRDNSCIYATVIYGCTDPKALNYDPEATHNSGLCEYVKEIGGCTDANALNYDSLATYNDGSCQYPREIIHGCTDTFALNYNPYAEIDNNTCEYRTVSDTIVGCMDAKAINYNPLASVSSECIYEKVDSVIVVEGCTDPKAANYNEKATKEDGSCVYANPISTYNDVAEVIVNDNQEVVVVVDTVKSIGVVETNGCEIDFAEKIDSVSVKVLSYDDNELITNWEVYQAGSVIYYDNVTVTCTEKEFVVLNLSLICNKNMRKPSGLRAKSTKVYAATLRSLVDLRDFGTTTIVLDENVASLYVYPNPASEIIYVEAPSLKDKTLQMVNLNGEVVKVVKANSNKLQITVSDLTAGAYILFSQDGSVSETVIIK